MSLQPRCEKATSASTVLEYDDNYQTVLRYDDNYETTQMDHDNDETVSNRIRIVQHSSDVVISSDAHISSNGTNMIRLNSTPPATKKTQSKQQRKSELEDQRFCKRIETWSIISNGLTTSTSAYGRSSGSSNRW